MRKKIIIVILLFILGAGGTLLYLKISRSSKKNKDNYSGEFCIKHQIAEKNCPWCDKSLIESKGQCAEHGVPEALCTKCNPALIPGFKAEDDWCGGHNIPESQCIICNPDIPAPNINSEYLPKTPSSSVELIPMPDLPRNQRAPSVTCKTSSSIIRFKSAEIASAVGLKYSHVDSRKVKQVLLCNAEIVYDDNMYARLASRAPGVVKEVKKDLGQTVKAGEILVIVDSPDLGTAKAEYLQARALTNLREKNYTREKRLMKNGASTEKEILEAETKLTESRIVLSRASQILKNLGLLDSQLKDIFKKQDTSSQLPLMAPFSGIIVERAAVVGEVVDIKKSLFSVADTSRMWAILDIYEFDIPKVRKGQTAIFRAEGIPDEHRGGKITWISSYVDKQTRTLKVRAEIDNSDNFLRSGMFGKAVINIRDKEQALVIPKDSVQWEGCCNVVFVKKSEVIFEPRKVKLGYETDRFFVVESGVSEGEEIVTTGSFLLKTELLKESIGAGCCEVEPGKRE
jgi:cobalt-zinc-cadmium efflux system membrane fusion protein